MSGVSSGPSIALCTCYPGNSGRRTFDQGLCFSRWGSGSPACVGSLLVVLQEETLNNLGSGLLIPRVTLIGRLKNKLLNELKQNKMKGGEGHRLVSEAPPWSPPLILVSFSKAGAALSSALSREAQSSRETCLTPLSQLGHTWA